MTGRTGPCRARALAASVAVACGLCFLRAPGEPAAHVTANPDHAPAGGGSGQRSAYRTAARARRP